MSTPNGAKDELVVAFTPQQLAIIGVVVALFFVWRRLAAQGR